MQEFYEFASFRLDIKKRRLTCRDEIIPLTPKEFDVLFLLIKNAGRVVEKDELLETVWKDTFVEEGTLTRNISWLRKKLAAHNSSVPKIIETLPKRGYRFLPEVRKSGKTVLFIEEQTIQHIQIEEVVEILPSSDDNEISFVDGKILETPKLAKALPIAQNARRISKFWIIPVLLIFVVLVFIAYSGYFSDNQPEMIMASKIAPFSGLPGREITPAFSPDGKQLVYAWDGGIDGGNLDIYVKIIGAGEPVRLTETETDEINPVFSPDGKSIAFVRNFADHNEIILIPALGGAERKIYDRASFAGVSFSPDGKFIAHANLDLSQKEAGLFLINMETGEKKSITSPENLIVDHTPRFSPDGKMIAFIRHFGSFSREIFVVSANGGEPRQITSDNVRIYSLAWNIDGQTLFFTSYRNADRINLWQVSLSGKEPQMIPTGSKEMEDLAVSPDGKTIAFVEDTVDDNIWEITENRSHPIIRSIRGDHSQQFSPDGTKIVFASDRTGNYEVWIADADGKNQRQLTDSGNSAGTPRFSPDGNFIVYDAQNADASDIYVVSIDGGAAKKLTESSKTNFLPAWSADGKTIFFVSNRSGVDQIWKMSAGGGEAVQITKHGGFEIFAAPDNKTIIYSKGRGKPGIWSVGINGEDEKPVPELIHFSGWRSWTVASSGIYYTAYSMQPPFVIKFFDFATRQTKEIARIDKSPLLYYSNLSVSEDGKKILYAQQDQNSSTIMFAKLN